MDLNEQLAEARRELDEIISDLAVVQDQLAGPRLARRAVREEVSVACMKLNHTDQIITDWRPPTPEEVQKIDDVHARTAPLIAELTPIERTLKEARRVANVKVDAIKKAIKRGRVTGGKTGGKTGGETFPGLTPGPKGTGDRGTGPPVAPS